MVTWGNRGDIVGGRRARTVSTRWRRERSDSASISSNSRAMIGLLLSATSGPWSADRIRNTSLAPPPTTVVRRPPWPPPPLRGRRVRTPLSTRCPYGQPRSDDDVTRHSNCSSAIQHAGLVHFHLDVSLINWPPKACQLGLGLYCTTI